MRPNRSFIWFGFGKSELNKRSVVTFNNRCFGCGKSELRTLSRSRYDRYKAADSVRPNRSYIWFGCEKSELCFAQSLFCLVRMRKIRTLCASIILLSGSDFENPNWSSFVRFDYRCFGFWKSELSHRSREVYCFNMVLMWKIPTEPQKFRQIRLPFLRMKKIRN